jgi:DNA-directed RNA polymerase subunit K/omega
MDLKDECLVNNNIQQRPLLKNLLVMYEAITIMAKRANQINSEIKKELTEKLEEFATYNDSLEEVLKIKNKLRFQKFMKINHMH